LLDHRLGKIGKETFKRFVDDPSAGVACARCVLQQHSERLSRASGLPISIPSVVEGLIIGDALASLSAPAADGSLGMITERDDTGRSQASSADSSDDRGARRAARQLQRADRIPLPTALSWKRTAHS
jgi:hypothetical protein